MVEFFDRLMTVIVFTVTMVAAFLGISFGIALVFVVIAFPFFLAAKILDFIF